MTPRRDREMLNGKSMLERWMDDVDLTLRGILDEQKKIRDMALSLKFLFWTAIAVGIINLGATAIKLISAALGH